MTRTTTNRTPRENAPRETLDAYIRRRALQADADFQDAKKTFTESFATNPSYAIEWHAKAMVQAETRHVWWTRLLSIAASRGAAEAITLARQDADRQVDSFFGSNSTCPWHNAMRRAEAETYNHLLRRVLPELEEAAKERTR